jgi:hypothetical protein
MFKPTLARLITPIVIVVMALLPLPVVRIFVFETLAYPFGDLFRELRYTDKPYLSFNGVLCVALIWAVISYVMICVGMWIIRRNR